MNTIKDALLAAQSFISSHTGKIQADAALTKIERSLAQLRKTPRKKNPPKEFLARYTKPLPNGKKEVVEELTLPAKNATAARESAENLTLAIFLGEAGHPNEISVEVIPLKTYLAEQQKTLRKIGRETQKTYNNLIHKQVSPNLFQTNWELALSNLLGGKPSSWESLNMPDSGVGIDYGYVNKAGQEVYINVDQTYCTISTEEETIFSGELHELNGY